MIDYPFVFVIGKSYSVRVLFPHLNKSNDTKDNLSNYMENNLH